MDPTHGASTHANYLLANLDPANLGLLEPHLEPLEAPLRLVFEQPGKPIKHVYFPESGLASVVAVNTKHQEIEAGVIGREGMTGVAVIMGDDRSPNATYVQMAGRGLRMKVPALRQAMEQSKGLRVFLLRYAATAAVQAAQTALANGRGNLEERLARWVLMAHDRLDGSELPLTHEFLSIMLGVRRAGVTVAVNLLQERKLIEARRGIIMVRNRRGLEKVAAGLYGVPEAEYQRLMGWKPGR